MNKTFINSKFKKIFVLISIILFSFLLISFLHLYTESEKYFYPNYEKIDLTSILSKKSLEPNDYKTLLYQTGLGKVAIDELLYNNDGKEKIIKFQDTFFNDTKIRCEDIGIITKQESIVNKDNEYIYGFNLAPYKNGYIILTKATHSFGWRHGHAAIVTDASNDETLEAIILGSNSSTDNIKKWRIYPSFIMLRLKDVSDETLNEISSFAKNTLNDKPYNLLVGILGSKNPPIEKLKGTHCSHLVWYAFKQFGYDIDSTGSFIVTPKDIANSDLFEIVQIYGVNPDNIWP